MSQTRPTASPILDMIVQAFNHHSLTVQHGPPEALVSTVTGWQLARPSQLILINVK